MEPEKNLELKRLPNGIIILSPEAIIAIHNLVIEDRKLMGKNDPNSILNPGLIQHLCDQLLDRPHKYTANQRDNALYVATETFYYIACEHPFTEGNKSTAYVCALLLLDKNLSSPDRAYILDSTPKEAEEIVKLAGGGKDPKELRKLIKEFLQKEISA